jgi:hypothetical protein
MKQYAIVTSDKTTYAGGVRPIHYFLKGTLVRVLNDRGAWGLDVCSVGPVVAVDELMESPRVLQQVVNAGDVLYLDAATCAAIEAEVA